MTGETGSTENIVFQANQNKENNIEEQKGSTASLSQETIDAAA